LPPFKEYRKQCLDQVEQTYLERLMREAEGSIKQACNLSGLSRTRLYVLMKEHGVSK
jgi:two-component system NtrC family response regulator